MEARREGDMQLLSQWNRSRGEWSAPVMWFQPYVLRITCNVWDIDANIRISINKTETFQLLVRLGGRVVILGFLSIVYPSSDWGWVFVLFSRLARLSYPRTSRTGSATASFARQTALACSSSWVSPFEPWVCLGRTSGASAGRRWSAQAPCTRRPPPAADAPGPLGTMFVIWKIGLRNISANTYVAI